jgi:hypothetical protein
MVDTHTSNGADYSYTMTLIHTQTDKLGGPLGTFLRETMVPAIYQDMDQRGWPTSPYVHPIKDIPDDGIEHTLEVPRFSTGYAALHHTIGFMPETHMLKPFADRYAATRALVESVLGFTIRHAAQIQAMRRDAKQAAATQNHWPVHWKIDYARPTPTRFRGFKAVYSPSKLGNYMRLSYDRSQPWERDIDFFDRCVEDVVVRAPRAYLIPQAWREVIERLQWNGVQMQRLTSDQTLQVQTYRIQSVTTRPGAYEGSHVPRRHDAQHPDRNGSGPGGRLAGAAGPAQRPFCGGNAGATGARQLFPLGIFQQRAGEKRELLGLRV